MRALEIEHATFTGKDAIRITVSVGLAQIRSGESPAQWLERADRALYQAKDSGRDRLSVAE